MKREIRRFYTEEWDEKFESTAEMDIIDLCPKCFKKFPNKLFEEEEIIPPQDSEELYNEILKRKQAIKGE